MRIYLKRDKSDEISRYIVFSESGEELYKISGKHSRSSHRLYINSGDKCIAKIRDTHLALLRTCYIATQSFGCHLTITSHKSKMMVAFHGVPLHVRGDVLNKSYDILDIDNTVLSCICRRFSTSHDALEININDDKYEILSIATAVCLDSLCTTDVMALQAT